MGFDRDPADERRACAAHHVEQGIPGPTTLVSPHADRSTGDRLRDEATVDGADDSDVVARSRDCGPALERDRSPRCDGGPGASLLVAPRHRTVTALAQRRVESPAPPAVHRDPRARARRTR